MFAIIKTYYTLIFIHLHSVGRWILMPSFCGFFCSILVSAFMGTAIAFACFSGAAMLARRREYLYLGGFLSSGVSILFWLHFASSIFGGSVAMFQFEVNFLIPWVCLVQNSCSFGKIVLYRT